MLFWLFGLSALGIRPPVRRSHQSGSSMAGAPLAGQRGGNTGQKCGGRAARPGSSSDRYIIWTRRTIDVVVLPSSFSYLTQCTHARPTGKAPMEEWPTTTEQERLEEEEDGEASPMELDEDDIDIDDEALDEVRVVCVMT